MEPQAVAAVSSPAPYPIEEGEAEKQAQQSPSTETMAEETEKDTDKRASEKAPSGVEEEWVTGIKLLTVMASVSVVCLLMLLDISIIVTAIPRITSDFHSLPDVGWYGSAYQLASAALQPLTGKFYYNFNSKWTYLCFIAVFELGSLICGVANSSKMLIVGRAVAGMGASGIQNGTFTIIAACVPMVKRPTMVGFAMGVAQLGLIAGPLVGGALTQFTSWRWCFYINLPIGGVVAALLLLVQIPQPNSKPKGTIVFRTVLKNLDLIGFALFAPAAIQFLLALQYGGNQYAWNSATVIGLFCGAAGTFAIFLAWEYHEGDDAMIPFSMLRNRTVWSSCFVFGFVSSMMFCASYYLPVYFQSVKGVSPTTSGVYLLPSILSQLIMAVVSGVMVGKLGYYLPWSIFCAVATAIANGLLSTLSPGTPTGKWIGYQILVGAGRGAGLQMPIVAVQNSLKPTQIPVAMALVMFSSTFFGAMFLSFADTIFNNSLKSLIHSYAPSLDPQTVVAAGATAFRNVVPESELAGVLAAYAGSVDRVFYLAAGASVGCCVLVWGMGWKDIRTKKQVGQA